MQIGGKDYTPPTTQVAPATTTIQQTPSARPTTPDPGFTTLKIPTVSELIANAYDAIKKIEEAAREIMTNLKKAIEDAFGERVNKMDEAITNLASDVEMIKNPPAPAAPSPGTGLNPDDLEKIQELTGKVTNLESLINAVDARQKETVQKYEEALRVINGINARMADVVTWAHEVGYEMSQQDAHWAATTWREVTKDGVQFYCKRNLLAIELCRSVGQQGKDLEFNRALQMVVTVIKNQKTIDDLVKEIMSGVAVESKQIDSTKFREATSKLQQIQKEVDPTNKLDQQEVINRIRASAKEMCDADTVDSPEAYSIIDRFRSTLEGMIATLEGGAS